MTKFETGQTVYDADGNSARYLGADDHGHAVLPYGGGGDTVDWLGEHAVWPEVFADPPKMPLHFTLVMLACPLAAISLMIYAGVTA